MENTIKIISQLLGTTLVVLIKEQLSKNTNSQLLALIMAVIISVIIMMIFEYLTLKLPRRVLFFRRFIYPLANFEGDWIQTSQRTNRSHSYCRIEYNLRKDTYSFYGTNFDSNGDERVTFYCQNIIYEDKLNGFTYSVEGQMFDTSEFMKCWGYVCFNKELFSNKFTIAKGYFVDIGTKLEGCRFYMEKVTIKMVKRFSQDSTPKSHEEFKEFMKAYYLGKKPASSSYTNDSDNSISSTY